MKYLRVLLLAAAIAIAGFPALSAQSSDAEWVVVVDRFDLINLYRQGSALMSEGFAPVAFDFSDDGLAHLVFVRQLPFEVEAWRIEVFDEADEVNDEIASLVERGWMPVDITFHRDQMAVLLLSADATVRDWGISQSDPAPQNIQAAMNVGAERRMTMLGLTAHGDRFWYLFVEIARNPLRQAQVVSTTTESFYESVNRRVAEGYAPWTLSFVGERVYVLFLK